MDLRSMKAPLMAFLPQRYGLSGQAFHAKW